MHHHHGTVREPLRERRRHGHRAVPSARAADADGQVGLALGCIARKQLFEELFQVAGALRTGHFLLKSGRHSSRYLEKFAVLQYPSLAVEVGRRLAETLAPQRPTLVVGPTTGGVLLAFETARQLETILTRMAS